MGALDANAVSTSMYAAPSSEGRMHASAHLLAYDSDLKGLCLSPSRAIRQ